MERGTPTGELLRRYWHPCALASDATGKSPPCVSFDAESARYRVLAGNYFSDDPAIFEPD